MKLTKLDYTLSAILIFGIFYSAYHCDFVMLAIFIGLDIFHAAYAHEQGKI